VRWIAALVAALIAAPAGAQDNIDAGKTPAQIFSDTCSACHRRPQELRRASAGFLRQHYTPGSAEAAAMASYLAKVGSDSRALEQRRERSRIQQERAKAAHGPAQGKGRRPQETGKAKAATVEAKAAAAAVEALPEPPPAAIEPDPPIPPLNVEPPPEPRKVLVPFEE
jgi:hypothetical protein